MDTTWTWILKLSTPALTVLIIALSLILSRTRTKAVVPTSPPLDKNKDRADGEWHPVEFRYPAIPACTDDLGAIKPIPYRPFRWGPYHTTMGIRNMPWEDWIELDNQFPAYHRIRAHRIRTRGRKAVCALPAVAGVVASANTAALELVHELAEYLGRRYPRTFSVAREGIAGAGTSFGDGVPVRRITIVPLGVSYEVPALPVEGAEVSEEEAVRALEIAALLVQDDLALMVEGTDGRYYFMAGAICVPGFWRMEDKIGKALEEIHLSGKVPHYAEKLEVSMGRFFKRMAVDKPVVRNNYFFQVVKDADEVRDDVDPEELAWSTTTNGPEDDEHGGTWEGEGKVRAETLRLRTERQTLRRLPRSGAIVFTIRTYMFGVEELGREKGVPGRMASAVRSWSADVQRYKGEWRYGEVLLKYLDECHGLEVMRE